MADLQIKGALAAYGNGFSLSESSKQKTMAEPETEATKRDPRADFVVELSELSKKLSEEDNPFSEALASATGKPADSEESGESEDPIIRALKQQIAQVKAEIEQLKQKHMDEDTKRKYIALKQNQLNQLQTQLQKAMEEKLKREGITPGSGPFYATGSLT